MPDLSGGETLSELLPVEVSDEPPAFKRLTVLNLGIKTDKFPPAGPQRQFAGGRTRLGEALGRAEGAGENAVSAPQEQPGRGGPRRLLDQHGYQSQQDFLPLLHNHCWRLFSLYFLQMD